MKYQKGDKVKCVSTDEGIRYLTLFKIYTVVRDTGTMIDVYDDEGDVQGYYTWRFEPVEKVMAFEKQLTEAKTMLGKRVVSSTGIIGQCDEVIVVVSEKDRRLTLGPNTLGNFARDGFVVVLASRKPEYPSLSFLGTKLLPEVEVKLNDTYTAIVSKDSVVVGCQTFSKEVIEAVYKELQELQ